MTTVALVGLGYVGLPIACALAREGFPLIAYDIDKGRIKELSEHRDRTGECSPEMKGGGPLPQVTQIPKI